MPRRHDIVPVPPSRAIAGWLSLSFLIPFALVLALYALKVPLGQGYFVYRYSPVRHLRAVGAVYSLPVTALACAAVWLLGRRGATQRGLGLALFIASVLAMAAWAWLAPPQAMTQQMFNLTSPSSD